MASRPIVPDELGHFGIFGCRYVSETLMPAILQLEKAYLEIKDDPAFKQELDYYLTEYVGRPTPLYFAESMTKDLGGAKIYLKREDLAHTGAHKVNNTIGQALLDIGHDPAHDDKRPRNLAAFRDPAENQRVGSRRGSARSECCG